MKTAAQRLAKLEALNWDRVHRAGVAFRDVLVESNGYIQPTAEDLADLIMLTAKLLEFVAEARGIVHDSDSLSNAC